MKRKLFWAALVGVAFTSCVSDETSTVEESQKLMKFDAPVFKTQSRVNVLGEITGTTYPVEESFKVYAYSYKGSFSDETVLTPYFDEDGEQANNANGGSSRYWVTAATHYWPDAAHNLAFIAYSPAELNLTGCEVTSDKESGLQIKGFETQAVSDNQYDLMYSNRVLDRNVAQHGSIGVPLVFNHALSSIVFSAQRDENTPEIKISGIKITGNFATKGDFTQGIEESTEGDVYSESNNPEWTETDHQSVEYKPTFTEFEVPVEAPSQFTKGTSALLLIPQDVPDDAAVTITYKTKTGEDFLDNVKTIKLNEFIVSSNSSPVANWEVGKRYVYRIAFGASQRIYFEPAVVDWDQQETAIYTINSGASGSGVEP